jgi:hypothetical protein
MRSDIDFKSDYTGDSWCDKFGDAAIKNTPHDDNYLMFETFGEDIANVLAVHKLDPKRVWTLIEIETPSDVPTEIDLGFRVISGYHLVNRIGYYLLKPNYLEILS